MAAVPRSSSRFTPVGVLLAGLYVIVASVSAWFAVDEIRALNGIAGMVKVDTCDEGQRHSWHCEGGFKSDDGSVRVPRVSILVSSSAKPVGQVAARIADADSTMAVQPGRWGNAVRFAVAAIVCIAAAPFAFAGFFRVRGSDHQPQGPVV